ncbi:DUF3300 domain-containing protein [Nordella sp. HKS 07]|uniref:DUF3300 domain-containing protein n=1 Tax=Nordella sp. HKS 07 TaxID=2712222 RepID=UPI0013E13693|nr:DUF3300 domain-containing protein [Nordella sp. HKS 07]QIG51339.1 DUF3300 domain-containing protein [Nordella sp. HKS 07]
MSLISHIKSIGLTVATITIFMAQDPAIPWAQEFGPTPAAAQASESQALSADQLETLVARIALYPDDLVALVMASSLYPLQLVQANRYLSDVKTKPDLKPDPDWDGSVIALLNYPDIIKMMNDDLKWTEQLGDAVVSQQKDLLVAVQELRDRAVASGVLKSDSKVTIQEQNDNVIITPAKKEATYVPQYDPAILSPTYVYEEGAPPPVYYGDPYPSYYYPYAPYWPGFFTGMFWGAAIDWDDWHSWGGDVDIDIDINNMRDRVEHWDRNNLNNINWDRNKFNFDRDTINNRLRENNRDRLDRKGDRGNRVQNLPAGGNRISGNDVRRDVQQGLKKQAQQRPANAGNRKPGQGANRPSTRPSQGAKAAQRNKGGGAGNRAAQRPASKVDRRPKQMSGLGDYDRGRATKQYSKRGQASRGGRGGYGGGQKIRRPSGGRGRGGGGRGGGGRGGRR